MGGCCGTLRHPGTELPDVTPGYGKKSTLVHQQKTWEATGVVSLRDSKLKDLPKGVDRIGDRVRTVDVSNNMLDALPASLTPLNKIERLVVANNNISSILCDMTSWNKLKVLDMSQNALTVFPVTVTSCPALEILKLTSNSVPSIPAELGNCTRLKELHLSSNAIESIPPELGACTALELIDLSSNRLREISSALGSLVKLRRLLLNSNQQLAAVSGAVLGQCVLLHTLELHGTQVTREVLQQTDGYEDFERRRQSKFSKAIDGNVMMNESGVDEGVDVALK